MTYSNADDLLLDVALVLALDECERRFPRFTEQQANRWAAEHVAEFVQPAWDWCVNEGKNVAARRRVN